MHFRHRQTDRQTDTDIVRSINARCTVYILHLALKNGKCSGKATNTQ